MKFISIICLILTYSCNRANPSNPETKESHLGLLWSYFTAFSSAPLAEPLLDNNFVYITGGLGLHKVSNIDGSRNWFTSTDGTASSLLNFRFIQDDENVIGLKPNYIVAFNKQNGQLSWEINIPDSIYLYEYGLGARFNESAFFTGDHGYIIELDIKSGETKNLFKFPFRVRNINVFDKGDLLIPYEDIHSEEPITYTAVMGRWRPSTKEWIWQYRIDGNGTFTYRYPQIDNNIVYSGFKDYASQAGYGFIAIDATTGQEIWKTIKTGLITGFHVLTPDTIYASALNFLYALDRHTGEVLWETEPMGISESTRIHYKNGYVYWCHNNGIFIYDAKTGKQVHYQPHEFGGYIWTSTMAEDRLLVQTSTHLLAYELYNPEE